MRAQQHVTLLVLCLFDVRYSPTAVVTLTRSTSPLSFSLSRHATVARRQRTNNGSN